MKNKVFIRKGAKEKIRNYLTSSKDSDVLLKAIDYLGNKNISILQKTPKISNFSLFPSNYNFHILRVSDKFLIVYLIEKEKNAIFIIDVIYKMSDENVRSMLATLQ